MKQDSDMFCAKKSAYWYFEGLGSAGPRRTALDPFTGPSFVSALGGDLPDG